MCGSAALAAACREQQSYQLGSGRSGSTPGAPTRFRGNTDAAMVTDCTAGGVPWSETVQLYTAGPMRLGGVDLGDLTHSREVLTDLSITDGVAHVTWLANGPNDAMCCPTIKMAADLRWDGSTVSAQNVRRLN